MCLLPIQRGGFFKLSPERGREIERGADLNHDIASFRLHAHFLFFITQNVSFYLTTLPGLWNQIILIISQYCWGQTYWRLTLYTHLQFLDDKMGKQIPFAQRDSKKRACAAAHGIISCRLQTLSRPVLYTVLNWSTFSINYSFQSS